MLVMAVKTEWEILNQQTSHSMLLTNLFHP